MSEHIVFGLGVLAGLIAAGLYFSFKYEVRDLVKRVKLLEEATSQRMNYKTMEGIENAEAALLKAQREVNFNQDLLNNVMAHLRHARNPEEKEKP